MIVDQRPSPLRTRRFLRGWRLRDVERRTGIRDCTLSEIERGEMPLRGRALHRLASLYATPSQQLLDEMRRWVARELAGTAEAAPP
jgi:transcriptional regulator with XRE-family HTH domain